MSSRRPWQLVATIGPASWDSARVIVDNGATALRLNGSHIDASELAPILAKIRGELPTLPCIVDLQGAKMRLGSFAPTRVEPGQRVVFSAAPPQGSPEIPLPHPEIFASARPGDTLRCDDDRLRFRVRRVSPLRLDAESLSEGTLLPRKGVGVVEHPVALADLTAADEALIREALPFAPVDFAISFVLDGREAAWVRERAPLCGVVGKVERKEAIANYAKIAARVDGIWICRGDLGSQLGPAGLARWVSRLCPSPGTPPVLMAGQVLEHLTSHPHPTRSEICHLYDLIDRGYAGIVLSDETAIGRDPVHAVRVASDLIEQLCAARDAGT